MSTSFSTDALRCAVALLCSYETAAIVTRRVPTLSRLTRRYPALGVVLIGGLVAHFYAFPSKEDR